MYVWKMYNTVQDEYFVDGFSETNFLGQLSMEVLFYTLTN